MRKAHLLVALFLPVIPVVFGQETSAPQKTVAPQHKPGEVEIQFANGSTVRMVLETEAIEVKTPYGALSVPARDIRQIEFGVHLSDEVEKQIEESVRKLMSANFRDRDSATSTLLRLGADAYPAVHEAANSSADLEAAKRAKSVLQTMAQKIPQKDLRLQYNDQIVTPTFTIAGRIVTQTIKAKAEYFGAVQLQVAQLRLMRSTDVPAELNVHVDAGKYGSQNGEWMATDLTLDARTKIVVTATGTVNLRPNIPQAAMECNANGYNNTGVVGVTRARRPGALVGRIGTDGPSFVIGESYEGQPGRDGKLFLQILPSPYNPESSGGYQVKVAIKH